MTTFVPSSKLCRGNETPFTGELAQVQASPVLPIVWAARHLGKGPLAVVLVVRFPAQGISDPFGV